MVLDAIPFRLDADALFAALRLPREGEHVQDVMRVASQAEAAARPKAFYRVVFLEERGPDTVTAEGITFTSRVLRANLDDVERIFPYVATCGIEMDGVPVPEDNVFGQFCRDAVKAMALGTARAFLLRHLQETYGLKKLASMNPGSGDADLWPIEQQKLLFALLGDVKGAIGVTLTETCLMLPNKTVSGLFYPTDVDFAACQLCHREGCPHRRASFDAALHARTASFVPSAKEAASAPAPHR